MRIRSTIEYTYIFITLRYWQPIYKIRFCPYRPTCNLKLERFLKNFTALTINHVKKRNSPYVSCQSRPNLTLLTMNKQTNHSLLRTSRNVIEMTRLMSQFHTVAVAIARPLTATGKISDKISHVPIHKITLEGLKSPTHNIFPTSKVEFGSFRPKCFSVFGPFQAVALAQSLRY